MKVDGYFLGFATVLLKDGTIHRAEIHWCEAHGIGRKVRRVS
jgi:hypothetical protein